MQMTENRLISVLSKTSYNTYNSILSLQKMLLRISKQVSEIIILGDSITIKETNFNKKHKLLLEEKIGLEIQVMEIPSLNDLASGEKMLQFDLQKGDIIDLRPGSSIHLALLLQQSQMATRIGQSPITLCVPSARGNRIHLAKIGNKGVENSITQSIVGSGDLNAFVQSILREDEYIEKKNNYRENGFHQISWADR